MPFSKIPKSWELAAPPTKRFSNFCMSDETERVYRRLEGVINAGY